MATMVHSSCVRSGGPDLVEQVAVAVAVFTVQDDFLTGRAEVARHSCNSGGFALVRGSPPRSAACASWSTSPISCGSIGRTG